MREPTDDEWKAAVCSALVTVMSEISEEQWAAEWMPETAFRCWEMFLYVNAKPACEPYEFQWGMGSVNRKHMELLWVFGAQLEGWAIPTAEGHVEYVPMEKWTAMYDEWKASLRRNA